MQIAIRDRFTGRMSDATARVLCYVLGPVTGLFMLYYRHYSDVWSIRFHAFHSMLMTAVWAASWGVLRSAEEISPWFLSTLAREIRFAANLIFLVIWVFLLGAAWRGCRLAVIPWVHELAVRLARKYRGHGDAAYSR